VRLHAYTGKAKQRVRVKGAEPFVTRGVHEPLLVKPDGEPDRELFERVQQRLAADKRKAPRHIDPEHPAVLLLRHTHELWPTGAPPSCQRRP
jgi:hypothetical protein